MLTLMMYLFCTGDLEEALKALRSGNYQTAYALFVPLAEAGDIKALSTIGNMYLNGSEDFPANYSKAFDWYLKGVDKGDLYSYNNIAVLFRDGLGVNQDLVFAAALFKFVLGRAEENPGAAEIAYRNLQKLLSVASSEQLEKADLLGPEDLTIEAISRRRKSDAPGSPAQKISLLNLEQVTGEYTLTKQASMHPVKITEIREEKRDQIGYLSDLIGNTLPDGTFTSPNKHFKLVVPSFFGGDISIFQRSLRNGADNQVRLEENKDEQVFVSIVVTTKIPADQAVNADAVLQWAQEMQSMNSRHLPPGLVHITRTQGVWGEMLQVATVNRTLSNEYPASAMKVLPLANGLQCLGLNRIGFYKGYLVEVGIILPVKGESKGLIAEAEGYLNHLMGSLAFL